MEIAEAAVKEQLEIVVEIMKEQLKKGEKFVNEKVSFFKLLNVAAS